MLKILLTDSNHYQKLGMSWLITSQLADNYPGAYYLLPQEKNHEIADIIFRDGVVTLNFYDKSYSDSPYDTDNGNAQASDKVAIHIPFLYKGNTLKDISLKLEKILEVAQTDVNILTDKQKICCHFGLKVYTQLSDMENDVMILIGQGYDSQNISKMLNRSLKTVSTHYRNAFRKTGAVNRAEFYRYASFIAKCGKNERNTLCL